MNNQSKQRPEETENLTVDKLIRRLLELKNKDAEITVNIKQYNKRYGVIQLPIWDWCVNNQYGASITVHLPEGAYIAKLPKDDK